LTERVPRAAQAHRTVAGDVFERRRFDPLHRSARVGAEILENTLASQSHLGNRHIHIARLLVSEFIARAADCGEERFDFKEFSCCRFAAAAASIHKHLN
jgi:hypothetical protein